MEFCCVSRVRQVDEKTDMMQYVQDEVEKIKMSFELKEKASSEKYEEQLIDKDELCKDLTQKLQEREDYLEVAKQDAQKVATYHV